LAAVVDVLPLESFTAFGAALLPLDPLLHEETSTTVTASPVSTLAHRCVRLGISPPL
jgi:hypothetical protein